MLQRTEFVSQSRSGGTSISFGTPTVIASDNNSIGHAVVYDPVVQKTVVAFKSGDYANAAVKELAEGEW